MSKKKEEAKKKKAPTIREVDRNKLLKDIAEIAKTTGIRLVNTEDPENTIPGFHRLVSHFPESRNWDNQSKSFLTAFFESLRTRGKDAIPMFLDDGDPVLIDLDENRKMVVFG